VSDDDPTGPKDPAAMAAMLTATTGRTITAEQVEAHVADGAPVATDGTLRLVEYAAWLLKASNAKNARK
jgi:hypothetical protein